MDNFDITTVLLAYRKETGYSIRDMANKLHVSKSAYERLEKGITQPSYEEIQRILNLLGRNNEGISGIDPLSKSTAAIRYVKRGLLYNTILLDEALGCLKDLAEATECGPLLEWTELEINGCWRKKEKVPAYRRRGRRCEVVYEQAGEFHENLILPDEFVDPDGLAPLQFAYFGEIDEWDQRWPANDGKSYNIEDRLIPVLEPLLQKIYGPDFKVIGVMWSISARFTRKVIMAIQEVMLRFLLDLEKEFGPTPSIQELKMHKHLLGTLFRKALEAVGRGDHLDLPIKFIAPEKTILSKGDVDAFLRWLYEHDVWDVETDEFFELFELFERNPPPEGTVPPEMYAWAKKLTSTNRRFREDGAKLIEGLKILYGATD